MRAGGVRCAAWLLGRAATVRLLAGAAAAWGAALVPASGHGARLLLLGAALVCCIVVAAVLLVRTGIRRPQFPPGVGSPPRPAGAGRDVSRHRLGTVLVSWALSVVLLAGAAAAGVMLSRLHVPAVDTEYDGEVLVLTDPVTTASGFVRASMRTSLGEVTVISRGDLPPAGTRIALRASIRPDGASAAAFVDGAPEVVASPGRLWRIRAAARDFLARSSGQAHDGSALVPGLVVGDTGGLAPGLEDDMRTVSLTHLTAVSGSNITIVALAVMFLMRSVTTARLPGIGAAVVVTAGYVFVVGPEPSVTRAAGMGLVGAVVLLRGSGTRGMAVLALAVIGVLIVAPSLAVSASFHLSVAATASLVLVGPRLCDRLVSRGMPHVVASALAVPVTAQIGVTPVLLAHGGTMSAWSIPANIVAAPAVAPATLIGMVVLVLGAIASTPGVLGGACALSDGFCAGVLPDDALPAGLLATAGLLAAPAGWCCWWIARLARVGAGLPAAVWPWPEPPWGIVLAGVCALGLACAVLVRHRRAVHIGAGLLVLALVVGTVVPGVVGRVHGDWQVLICDVGQGSATVVRLGPGSVLLIDTGKESAPVDACLRSAGARVVHLLISHYDSDHSAGYPGVVQGRTLSGIQRSGPAGEHRRAVEMEERLSDVEVTEVAAGDVFGSGDVTWEVLWPEPGARGDSDESNALSVVVRVVTPGFSMIVPGDIGEAEQRRLAPNLPPADVLVAPHHGSGDLSEDFYDAAGAGLGVVSAGADNDYGHPARRSLDAFGTTPVVRTDLCGTIVLDAQARTSAASPGDACGIPAR